MRRLLRWCLPFLAVLSLAVVTQAVEYERQACTEITATVAWETWCREASTGKWKVYNGTGASNLAASWTEIGLTPSTGKASAAQGGTALDTSASTGTARVDAGTWSVGNVTLESYAFADLPAAGTAGRLARVTDDIGGVWMDSGAATPGWISLNQNRVYVVDPAIGAKCDGTTDDSTAFTTAVSRLPAAGGTIVIPTGTCLVKNWTINKSHVRVIGTGFSWAAATSPTLLRPPNGVAATDDVIRIPLGVYAVVLEHLAVSADAPNDTDFARTAVSAAGTGYKLRNVLLQGGVDYTFDTEVSGTPMDSADSGGITESIIYGEVRIKGSNFRLVANYMNGGGAGRAVTVESPSAGDAGLENIIADNVIESYGTPIIKLNNAGLAGVQAVAIDRNRLQASAGAGALIESEGVVGGLSIRGNRIRSGGGTPTRAIDLNNINTLEITGNIIRYQTEWSAGTQAPIAIITLGGRVTVDRNGGDGGDVEYKGYRSHNLITSGGSEGQAHTVRRDGILLTTADATPTTIFSLTLDASEILSLKARVISDNVLSAGALRVNDYERMATFVRRASGGAVQAGSTTAIHTAEEDAGQDVTMSASSNDALLQVTGLVGSVNWRANVEYLRK